MSTIVTPTLWVVPANDLEALEIRKLLDSQNQSVLVTRQPWGAAWSALEPDIRGALSRFRAANPRADIVGIELAGANPYGAIDIDHHLYADADRTCPLSSLEQVAARLHVSLNRPQQLVALNDRGYIPAMLAAGASPLEIDGLRAADRAAQGLTAEDEECAASDILSRSETRGRKILVHCLHRPTSAHSDRLFSVADEILLIGPSQWSYSGPRHQSLAAMKYPQNHWSGGSPASGYFGIHEPSPETQRQILQFFWS